MRPAFKHGAHGRFNGAIESYPFDLESPTQVLSGQEADRPRIARRTRRARYRRAIGLSPAMSAANDLATSYHIRDIGKILEQVQRDLETFKSGRADGVKDPHDLSKLIERAQADIELKTSIVLRSTLEPGPARIALRPAPPPATTKPASSLLQRRALRAQKKLPSIDRANIDSALMQQIMQVNRSAGPRNKDRSSIPGRIQHGQTTKLATVIPRSLRRDPLSTPPIISASDAKRGLLHLLSAGLIPRNADMTPALVGESGVLQQKAMAIHEHGQQFVQSFVSTFTPPSNLILDLTTPVHGAVHASVMTTMANSRSQPVPTQKKISYGTIAPVFVNDLTPVDVEQFVGVTDQQARGFNELLDTYSLHQFMIRHGSTLTATPEFSSFKRKYGLIWGSITFIIDHLESLMRQYDIPLVKVNGQNVVLLAEQDLRRPTVDDLLSCLVDSEDINTHIRQQGDRFKGEHGREQAASVISATWRMHKERKTYQFRVLQRSSAAAITRAFQMFLRLQRTRVATQNAWEQNLKVWRARQELFRKRWDRLRERRRIAVHLPSMRQDARMGGERSSISSLSSKLQDWNQLSRLFELSDDNIDILYVTGEPVSEEVQRYYIQLLQIGGVANVASRLKFLSCEVCTEPALRDAPISMRVYFSPKCINRIRAVTKGHSAYLVPNQIGEYDLRLAVFLGLPMLSAEPAVVHSFGSASGSRRVFVEAGVDCPIGTHDIYDEAALINSLSRLILANLQVQRWMIKLDNESSGRGLAYFDPSKLKITANLLLEKETSMTFDDPEVILSNRSRLAKALSARIDSSVKLVCSDLYPNGWKSYIEVLARSGASVEACPPVVGSPSVNMFIEPNGQISVLSTHDQIFSRPYIFAGSVFPQSSIDDETLRTAALSIGRVCAGKSIIGFVGVDFIVSPDQAAIEPQQHLMAVDLNLRLTASQLSFLGFDFLARGKFIRNEYRINDLDDIRQQPLKMCASPSSASSLSSVPSSIVLPALSMELANRMSQSRSFVSFGNLGVPVLTSIQHQAFFNICRLKGISFDFATRTGTAFMLVDSVSCGRIGLLCVADSVSGALENVATTLQFLKEMSTYDTAPSILNDLLVVVRTILKSRKQFPRPRQSLDHR